MVDVPDHLLKRAADARARLSGGAAAPASDAPMTGDSEQAAPSDAGSSAETAPPTEAAAPTPGEAGDDKIPAHLLDRTTPASERPAGAPPATAAPAAPPAAAGPPAPSTPATGTTQRLLTVVKAGSIQDVKATPHDKVHVWPHLLLGEFVAALAVTGFLLVFSIFVNAPLLELANFNETPNPSKAPWYFLGLQELLTMFHPMVAGVTIPGIGLFMLILAPYLDKNPSVSPERRKFAVALMTIHLMFWAVLVIIGSFFRGPGFNFIFPWESGLFFDF